MDNDAEFDDAQHDDTPKDNEDVEKVPLNFDSIAQLVHSMITDIQQIDNVLFMEIFYACIFVLNNSIYAWTIAQYGQPITYSAMFNFIHQLFNSMLNSPIYAQIQDKVQDRLNADELLNSIQGEVKKSDDNT